MIVRGSRGHPARMLGTIGDTTRERDARLALEQVNDDKLELEKRVTADLELLIMPTLDRLERQLRSQPEIEFVEALRESLAEIMRLSRSAVEFHRGNIRRRLGLKRGDQQLGAALTTSLAGRASPETGGPGLPGGREGRDSLPEAGRRDARRLSAVAPAWPMVLPGGTAKPARQAATGFDPRSLTNFAARPSPSRTSARRSISPRWNPAPRRDSTRAAPSAPATAQVGAARPGGRDDRAHVEVLQSQKRVDGHPDQASRPLTGAAHNVHASASRAQQHGSSGRSFVSSVQAARHIRARPSCRRQARSSPPGRRVAPRSSARRA